MNLDNYKSFAIVIASIGLVFLLGGALIFFMYPRYVITAGPPQGGEQVTKGEGNSGEEAA